MKKRKHKSSRSRQYKRDKFRRELKFCFIITIICLVVSLGLAIITGKMPDFLEKTIDRQLDRVVGEKKKEIERELLKKSKEGDVGDLMKKYMDKAKKYR